MKKRSIKKTIQYNRIETLEELRNSGARFEYEAICDNYVARAQNTDSRAESVHFAVALRNFAIATAIVLALFLAPRAIDAWKLYAYSQSLLWSQMYEREIELLEQKQKINIPALTRNVSAGIGALLLIAFIHKRFNRIRPRSSGNVAGKRFFASRNDPAPPVNYPTLPSTGDASSPVPPPPAPGAAET